MSQVRPYTRHQMRRYVNSAEYLYARGYGTTPQARAFASASSQYATQAAPVVSAYPFSVGVWFLDLDTTGRVLWSACDGTVNDKYASIWANYATPGAVALDLRNTTDTPIESTTTFVVGTWHHVLAVFNSATDRRIYLDGRGKGTDTTNLAFFTPTRMAFGATYRLSISDYFNGSLSEGAIWNVGFTDADAAFLNTLIEINGVVGYPAAQFIRPDALIGYWPMFGNGSPELDQSGRGYNLTLVNTPTKSTSKPQIVYPPMLWASSS